MIFDPLQPLFDASVLQSINDHLALPGPAPASAANAFNKSCTSDEQGHCRTFLVATQIIKRYFTLRSQFSVGASQFLKAKVVGAGSPRARMDADARFDEGCRVTQQLP